jgi:DNA-binding CsgD family transcriptional regulator
VGLEISALLDMDEVEKAGHCIKKYESSSAFDSLGNISRGIEIFYYVKGKYYLSVGKMDSAEYLFRKELEEGKDLNNQIAGCKGLQRVFERKEIPDSIAKYANLGYTFNDSAYSLSEMQNIQRLQASYNYNHKKQLAEQKAREAERAWLILALVVSCVIILLLLFSKKYYLFKKAALDYRLKNADIINRLRKMAKSNPPVQPSLEDWKQLRALVEREIPDFSERVNGKDHPLSDMEYDVCLMIRVHLLPIEIARLKKCTPSYVSNIRKSLLKRVYGKEGSSEDFDDEIGKIGN